MQKVHLLLAVNWILSCVSVWPAQAQPEKKILPVTATLDNALALTSGLTIDQKCSIAGDIKVSVTREAIKMVNHKDGMTLLFARPYKEVLAYNDKLKRIYSCPVESFNSPYALLLLNCEEITFCDLPLAAREATVYRGLTAAHYGFPPAFEAFQKDRFAHQVVSKRAPRSIDLIVASRLSVAPQIVHFVDAVYSFPPSSGLPLEFRYVTFIAAKHPYLISYNITRAKLTAGDFAPPKTYCKVSEISQITVDENSQAGIDFMTGH
jgi:hypothetical protein